MHRVAYVHDWLITRAGSEKVLDEMLRAIPADKVYTLFYKEENFTASQVSKFPVEASFLNRLPGVHRYYRNLLPLMPLAVESFDLSGYDLIISSSHAVAKGVVPHPEQVHVSYVHTPMRYAWDMAYEYLRGVGGVKRFIAQVFLSYMRVWDYATSSRVDLFLANSRFVAKRIKRYYGRDAEVVYPPVDVHRFRLSGEVEDYFITISRMVPYKKVDLIVRAFSDLGIPLLVIGDGPDMGRVKSLAGRNVELLGKVEDDVLVDLLSKARGFVFAAYEDFGIAPVEAMASGVPVIAYGRGGVVESVEEGVSGLFFYEQSVESIKEAVLRFISLEDSFVREEIRHRAMRFSPERFRREFKNAVLRVFEQFSEKRV